MTRLSGTAMPTIRHTTDRDVWEAALRVFRPPTFLQSWAWGETQRALGEDVIRIAAYSGETVVGLAQAVTVTARRAKFLHVPHGPVVWGSEEQGIRNKETISALLTALIEETRCRKLAFLRVSPIQDDTAENRELYRALGFRPAPIYLHAERLWVLDVTPSEDTLLAGMRKTTRNLTRRAEREGVTVRLGNGSLDVFLRLYAETARRERFVSFPRQAIEAEFAAFSACTERTTTEPTKAPGFTVLRNTVKPGEVAGNREVDDVLVGVAEWRGTPLAAAIVPLTSWSAFYHHGASVRTRESVPAGHALQWALIREAKHRGCTQYNFWGVARPDAPPSHPWHGLSLFKRGFGGREVPLVPTQDLSLSPRYWLAYTLDTLRRWKRGL